MQQFNYDPNSPESIRAYYAKRDADKLNALVEAEGYGSDLELFQSAMMDLVCPGICMNPTCDYTVDVEPDQDKGFCEECRTETVKSALVIGGII